MAEKVDIEDLKIYFYDSLLSNDQFDEDVLGTGAVIKKPAENIIGTGWTSGSHAMINYKGAFSNPTYSELIMKLRLSSMDDCKAFFGFRSNLTEPTLGMTESHAGLYIENGIFYLVTGDGDNQQSVRIEGMDLTKVFEWKIKNNAFYYKPLPQVETYLGMPTIVRVERVWKLLQRLTNIIPKNQVHYIQFYIKNNINEEKLIYLNRVIYHEEYAD